MILLLYMPIIDAHAHIFPTTISEKASRSIGSFYNTSIKYNGSVDELIKSGDKINVDHYIVHSTATKVEQVCPINDFIINSCNNESRFIGFGTIHPKFPDIHGEFNRMELGGLKGIKLHPDFQVFAVDDPLFDPVYEELIARDLPVLIHAGDPRYKFSNPSRFVNVIEKHPKLKMISAHFGGYNQWGDSLEYLAGKGCWFDTSSTLWKLSPKEAKAIMDKHGVENFLFGSDFPMWDHADELEKLKLLDLTDRELEAILWDNAAELLAIV